MEVKSSWCGSGCSVQWQQLPHSHNSSCLPKKGIGEGITLGMLTPAPEVVWKAGIVVKRDLSNARNKLKAKVICRDRQYCHVGFACDNEGKSN